jgi:hypothetical protein
VRELVADLAEDVFQQGMRTALFRENARLLSFALLLSRFAERLPAPEKLALLFMPGKLARNLQRQAIGRLAPAFVLFQMNSVSRRLIESSSSSLAATFSTGCQANAASAAI